MSMMDKIKKWYKGSTFEYYMNDYGLPKSKRNRKGDSAGLYWMLYIAILKYIMVTVFPVTMFIMTIYYVTKDIRVLAMIHMLWFGLPQIIYFWDRGFNRYLEETKRWKENG